MAPRSDQINLDISINGAKAGRTYNELIKDSRDLNRELRNLTPGTEAFIKKSAELQKVNQKLGDIRNATKGVSGEFDTLTKTIGASIAIFATTRLAGIVQEFGETAIQLESLDSKFKTVFGEAAEIVEASAQSQATSLGLTRQEYRKATADIGDLLIPMGFQRTAAAGVATELTSLSGALSAWSGGQKSATDVATILTKALLGEREEMKSLGISITEADVSSILLEKNQNKLTGTALQQAKALATLELIQAKSTDAQARFSGETKTLAQRKAELTAKIRDFTQELAIKAIPIIDKGIDVVTKLVGALFAFIKILASIPAFIKEYRVQLGLLLVAIVSLNAAAIVATTRTIALGIAQRSAAIFTTSMTVAQRLLNVAMRANPIGLVVSAIALLIGGLVTAYQKSEVFRAGINGLANVAKVFFDGIVQGIKAFKDGFDLIKSGDIGGGLKKFGEGLIKANPLTTALGQGKKLGDAFKEGYNKSLAQSATDRSAKDLLTANAALGQQSAVIPDFNADDIEIVGDTTTDKAKKGKAPKKEKAAKETEQVDFYTAVTALAKKRTEERLKELDKELNRELDLTEKKYLEGLIQEEEYQIARLQLKKEAAEKELEFLNTLGLSNTDEFRKAELKKLRAAKEISDQRIAIEKKHTELEKEELDKRTKAAKREAEIKQEINSAYLGAFQQFIDLSIDASNQETDARKKNASLIKTFETAKLLVNYYAEASGYFKQFAAIPGGRIIAGILSGLALIRTNLAVQKINSQKFEKGDILNGPSHTNGGIPFTIGGKPGFEAEGGEAMINKRSTSIFRPLLSAINSYRGYGKKFEEGGLTSFVPSSTIQTQFTSPQTDMNSKLESTLNILIDTLSSGIKSYTVYSEIDAKRKTIANLEEISRQ